MAHVRGAPGSSSVVAGASAVGSDAQLPQLPLPPTHTHVGVGAQIRFLLRKFQNVVTAFVNPGSDEEEEEWTVVKDEDLEPHYPPPAYTDMPHADTPLTPLTLPDPTPPSTLERASAWARQATIADGAGRTDSARLLYIKASNALQTLSVLEQNAAQRASYSAKATSYMHRAEALSHEAHAAAGRTAHSVGAGSVGSVGQGSAGGQQRTTSRARSNAPLPRWSRLEKLADGQHKDAIEHLSDHQHRDSKRCFIEAAETYTRAIHDAYTSRPDIVGVLKSKLNRALQAAESLNKNLRPVFATAGERGATTQQLTPLFSEASRRPQQQRTPSSNPNSNRRAQAQPNRSRANGKNGMQNGNAGKKPRPSSVASSGGGGGVGQQPNYWDKAVPTGSAPFVLTKVSPNSPIYNDATKLFYESMNASEWRVVDVQLVQHPRKWTAYCAKRAIMDASLPKGSGEMRAFHGTHSKHVNTIAAQGFLRDHNVTSAFGKGSYFAVNASYSVPGYCPPTDGVHTVFLARILVGEPCLGGANKEMPDKKLGGGGTLHESMVDNLSKPSIYILGSGSDDHAYPELVLRVARITE